jgi:heterotetrameric sarcosine oxidase gamma subunit
VIDVSLAAISGQTLFRLALWDDGARARIDTGLGVPLPEPCRAVSAQSLRISWLEDGHWLIACGDDAADRVLGQLETLVGSDGTLVEVGAALAGRSITGASWREFLMIGGVFDAEDPGFGAGSVARTVMHHSALLIDVIAADRVHAYVPASHAEDFFGFWDAEIARRHAAA